MSMINRLVAWLTAWSELRLLPQQNRRIVSLLESANETLERLYRVSCEDGMSGAAGGDCGGPRMLEDYGFKAYSQNDEDGILQEIFRRVGIETKSFVEFGAGSGLENNTSFLLCQGWEGLWIDGSFPNCEEIRRSFAAYVEAGRLVVRNAMLSRENINSEIAQAGCSGEIDLLSIDVDGNDLHLWKALTALNPRVVVIEYNGFVPPPVTWVMPYDESHVWDGRTTAIGASLQAIADLGRARGYRLVCCNRIGLNAFLVREDLARHFDSQRPVAEMFHFRKWWRDESFKRGQSPIACIQKR